MLSLALMPPEAAGQINRGAASPQLIGEIGLLLRQHCQMCHNSEVKKAGLDLSSREALLRGGDNGPSIVPGNAKASLLYKLIAHEQEPGMPYKADKLPEAVIARFAEWIDAGAPYGELGPFSGRAASANSSAPAVHDEVGKAMFVQHVRPLLESQCLSCHGAGQVKRSGFDLSTREGLLRGGENGPAVVPGKAQESALYKRVKHDLQPGMPFQGTKISDELITRIGDWINAGAPYDGPLNPKAARRVASNHWAYQLPKRPPVPVVKNWAWVRNPVDAFVAAEHEKRGLHPMPTADKRVLLRRVYLDLIGLPPTPDEMQAFLADDSIRREFMRHKYKLSGSTARL